MHQKIRNHFKTNDPILFAVIEKVEWREWKKLNQHFAHLCDAIISQQLSEKAGETIFQRFQNLFVNKEITPEKLLQIPDENIRHAGISWSKISYLKDLAQKVFSQELKLDKLELLSDEEVIKELTKVKGIGPWTAEMFLMFSLGREDVFSFGDLGLKNAMKKIYGFKNEPTKKQIEKIIRKWSPYKTYASKILWLSLNLK